MIRTLLSYSLTVFQNLVLQVGEGIGMLVARLLVEQLGFEEIAHGGGACTVVVAMQTPWWMLVLVMLWGFTLIPLPNAFDIRGWKEMHPLNNAQWSLMWEYIANVLYALVIRHFRRWMLCLFVLLSACLTVCLCLNIDLFGVLSENQYAYTVIGG